METQELIHILVDALAEKKGENILLLDVHELTSFTDYFLICTGSSSRMLNALSDGILEKTSPYYKRKNRPQGSAQGGWIVLDYGDIVVHLFDAEMRRFYDLEELWIESKVVLKMK